MTKQLLEAVKGITIISVDEIGPHKIWYTLPGDTLSSYVNTTTFVEECKDWAAEKGYSILSGRLVDGSKMSLALLYIDEENIIPFKEPTEHQAVFETCQYILDSYK